MRLVSGLVASLWVLLCSCGPSGPVWGSGAPRPPSGAGPKPFWHQDGKRVVDADGRPVVMRGVNLGGWLLWEGWMFGGQWSNDGESKLVARLAEVWRGLDEFLAASRVADCELNAPMAAALAGAGATAR